MIDEKTTSNIRNMDEETGWLLFKELMAWELIPTIFHESIYANIRNGLIISVDEELEQMINKTLSYRHQSEKLFSLFKKITKD